jgi:hypothetical protein
MNRGASFSADLTSEEEAEIRPLLGDRFFDLSASPPPTRGGAAFRYEIAIEDGSNAHRVVLSDEDVPDWMRPLIMWMERKAGIRRGEEPKSN